MGAAYGGELVARGIAAIGGSHRRTSRLQARCRAGNTRPMPAVHALIRIARATGAGRAWAATNNNRNNASLPRAGD